MSIANANDFLSRNFKKSEFRCGCGRCPEIPPHPDLVNMLQRVRDAIREPIKITSGIRCKDWNRSIGGAENSPHLDGLAVDIFDSGSRFCYYLIKAIQSHDCVKHIIIYPNHIHVSIFGTYRTGERSLWRTK